MSEPRTLIIGDTHGRWDALASLLIKEGVIDADTLKRSDHDVRVIHVGDLGDFSRKTYFIDEAVYSQADDWFDVLLWGNHDRASVSPFERRFNGYSAPSAVTRQIMRDLAKQRRLVLATSAHGFLITHAGLHPLYGRRYFSHLSPNVVAGKINYEDAKAGDASDLNRIWTSIGQLRGGGHGAVGGILWRDVTEKLWSGARQIFGHSVMKDGIVRTVGYDGTFNLKRGQEASYAIDVGAKVHEQQAGIWLPEERVASVGPAEIQDLYYGRDRT